MAVELDLCRKRRQAPDLLLQPERGAAGHRQRRNRAGCIQPLNRLNNMLQCDPRNRSTYHSGQLKVTQRFSSGLQFLGSYTYGKSLDYGGSAASGGGAVGNPQTVTNLEAGHGPVGVRRAPSRGHQLGLGAAVGPGRQLAARMAACSARSRAAGSSPASRR